MKKNLLFSFIAIFSLAVLFTSCKKNNDAAAVDEQTEIKAQSEDQAKFSGDDDEISNDVNFAVESSPSLTGRVESLICNATVTIDSTSTPRTITIVYNGLNCAGTRLRQGTVKISMSGPWRIAGATMTVTYQNLKITRVSDQKSITINGSKTHTNVTGGLLINLASLGVIKHRVASDGITVTFDNGSQRSWKIAKQREFTYNGGIVISTTGFHTDGALTGIAEWGINRYGNPFVSMITTPVVVRQDCNFRIVSGVVVHKRLAITSTITFGLDAQGNAITLTPPGPAVLYMKIVWVAANGTTVTLIRPY